MGRQEKIRIFESRLKELRKKKNKNMEYIADQIGVARSTYAGYETQGRFPPIETLSRLAVVLNTSTDYLIGLTDNPEPLQITRNIDEYLTNFGQLHWNGIPLSNDDLQPLRDLFHIILRERIPRMIEEESKTEKKSTN